MEAFLTGRGECYSISEAAQKIGRCYMTVWVWIKDGRLRSEKDSTGRHRIYQADLEEALFGFTTKRINTKTTTKDGPKEPATK